MTWVKKITNVLLLLCCSIPAQSQLVWPGDVNNNGIVNGVDLLWLGMACDANGPARPGGTTEWTAQPLGMPWLAAFSNGLNFANADADGNGNVNTEDIEEAIIANFRQTHGTPASDGYVNAKLGINAPAIKLVPSADVVVPGQMLEIKLLLGDSLAPVPDFYGIALKMHYSAELVNNGGADIAFTPITTWINPEVNDVVEELFYRDTATGDMEVAMVRINQVSVSGHGAIGSFSIIIEDIIVGIAPQFQLRIDSIMLIDETDTITAVVADTVIVTIKQKVRERKSETDSDSRMRISPNPSGPDATVWRLESSEPLHHLELIDGLGRAFPVSPQPAGEFLWLVPKPNNLPPGAYWLSGYTEKGVLQTQLIHAF